MKSELDAALRKHRHAERAQQSWGAVGLFVFSIVVAIAIVVAVMATS